MSVPRALLTAGLLLGSIAGSALSRADVSIQECSDAYTKGQEDRLAGRVSTARGQFVLCSNPACPAAIVHDCAQWQREVEAELPTIRVKVVDNTGQAIDERSLTLSVDGAPVASAALAAPIIVDAGPHKLHIEAPGFLPVDLAAELKPEDRNLPIAAVMQRAPAPPPAPPPVVAAPPPRAARTPTASIALASVGLVALGGSLYFGLAAKSRYDDLKKTCSPNCPRSQSDAVHTKAVLSDVALATSLVAFGAAAWLYLSSSPDTEPQTALSLEPSPNGARARLRLTF